jgi:hypothetical protein
LNRFQRRAHAGPWEVVGIAVEAVDVLADPADGLDAMVG